MLKLRKALNYDLSENLLKIYYPNPKSYKNALFLVKNYLCQNGFEKRQYSGVVSIEPMSDSMVQEIVLKISKVYTWLGPCVEKFDVTDVGITYSLCNLLKENKS